MTRFWIVGGEYPDCDFTRAAPGTTSVHGPYQDELKARMEWQRLTFRDRAPATRRYAIAVEQRAFGG
jgi:hypothetical protein